MASATILLIIGGLLWLLGATVLLIALARAAKRGDRGLSGVDDQAADLANEHGISEAEAARLLGLQRRLNAMRDLSPRGRAR